MPRGVAVAQAYGSIRSCQGWHDDLDQHPSLPGLSAGHRPALVAASPAAVGRPRSAGTARTGSAVGHGSFSRSQRASGSRAGQGAADGRRTWITSCRRCMAGAMTTATFSLSAPSITERDPRHVIESPACTCVEHHSECLEHALTLLARSLDGPDRRRLTTRSPGSTAGTRHDVRRIAARGGASTPDGGLARWDAIRGRRLRQRSLREFQLDRDRSGPRSQAPRQGVEVPSVLDGPSEPVSSRGRALPPRRPVTRPAGASRPATPWR